MDVITCAIFGDCRLRGVGVVRGVNLPSPIDLTRRRPYNTPVIGHTTVCLTVGHRARFTVHDSGAQDEVCCV